MSSSAAGVHAIAATMTTVPAVGVQRYAWLLLAFPVFGALVLICGGRRTDRWGHLLGVPMPIASLVYGVIAFFDMLSYPAAERSRDLHMFTWIAVGGFHVDATCCSTRCR